LRAKLDAKVIAYRPSASSPRNEAEGEDEFDRLVRDTRRINRERREEADMDAQPPDDGAPFRDEPPALEEDEVDREERDLLSRIVDGPALALDPEPVVEWVVEDIIPIEHPTIVSGNGGTGKTTLIAQLMAAMQIGGEWLGLKVKQGGALFVTSEEGRRDVNRMLRAILEGESKSLAHCPGLYILSLADRVPLWPPRRTGLQPSPQRRCGERLNG
jgi:hypothetical protein